MSAHRYRLRIACCRSLTTLNNVMIKSVRRPLRFQYHDQANQILQKETKVVSVAFCCIITKIY